MRLQKGNNLFQLKLMGVVVHGVNYICAVKD